MPSFSQESSQVIKGVVRFMRLQSERITSPTLLSWAFTLLPKDPGSFQPRFLVASIFQYIAQGMILFVEIWKSIPQLTHPRIALHLPQPNPALHPSDLQGRVD